MGEKFGLVTGAGTGIGRAAAMALIEAGWTLALIGRRLAPLEETVALAKSSRSFCVSCDVSSPVQVAKTFAEVEGRFGRLDLLFNNAGMAARSVPMEELSFPEWKAVVDVNLTGAFLCTQQAMRIMKAQNPRGGRIINNVRSRPMRRGPIPRPIPRRNTR